MNLRIITKSHQAESEIGFLTKSILKPYGRAAAMPTVWKLIFDPIKATATAFILVAYWHAPLPYQEEDYDNWNSIYAYMVFGLGNFLFTFLENIIIFKIFSIAPMKIVGFLFIYLVNFFFITSSFNSGILLLKRVLVSWPSVFDIFGVFMYCFLATKALDKASNGNEIV